MKTKKPKINSVRKTHGGKLPLAHKIIPLLEYRPIYVEGFCGGLSIYLNIDEKFDRVYVFDKDPDVIAVWKALQSNGDQIRSFLLNTTYDENNFKQACKYVADHKDEPDDYWYPAMLIIKNRFSRGGLGRDFAWSDRLRGGRPGDENAWINNIDKHLPRVIEKIQSIHFECGDFIDLTMKYGLHQNKDVIFYEDPPYIKSSRVSKDAYGIFEMSDGEHRNLLDFIKNDIKGVNYLSGYSSPLYEEELSGYSYVSWEVTKSSSQKKDKSAAKAVEKMWVIK